MEINTILYFSIDDIIMETDFNLKNNNKSINISKLGKCDNNCIDILKSSNCYDLILNNYEICDICNNNIIILNTKYCECCEDNIAINKSRFCKDCFSMFK